MDIFSKLIGDKRRWKQYKTRVKELPTDYRTTTEAFQRYFMLVGSDNGEFFMTILEDLVDLFEQSAAEQTPIRNVVGPDPVEFADEFLRNYPEARLFNKERERLIAALNRISTE